MVTPENENDILIHKLATIGVVRSFGPVGRREHFFSRLDMSPTSLQQVVEKFCDQLKKSQQEMVKELPPSVVEGWKKYSAFVSSPDYKKLSPEAKGAASKKLQLLRKILTMPVYSWAKFQVSLNL